MNRWQHSQHHRYYWRSKTVTPAMRGVLTHVESSKIVFSPGFRPEPRWRAYNALQDTLVNWEGDIPSPFHKLLMSLASRPSINHFGAGIKCGVRGQSARLKCRAFGAGQKCGVTCKAHGAGWRCYATGLMYSGLTTGEEMVMLAVTGYCTK